MNTRAQPVAVYRRIGARWLGGGGSVLALAVLLGPYIALGVAVASGHYGEGHGVRQAFPYSGRQLLLLAYSLLFSGAVAGGALLLGVGCALKLRSMPRLGSIFLAALPVLIAVPVYLHGLAWTACLASVAGGLPLRGWWGSGWVEVMALLPLATGIALVGLRAVDREQVEAASLHQSDFRVFRRIELPLVMPMLLAGFGLLFLISLLDYNIPSLFGVNVYAMEIFTGYSLDGNPTAAVVTALPLIVAAAAVMMLGLARARLAASTPLFRRASVYRRECWPVWLRIAQWIALALLLAQAVVPSAGMLVMTGAARAWAQAMMSARIEIGTTAAVAGMVLLLGLPLALLAAGPLSRADGAGKVWWALLCLPFAMPAPLTGIGAIHLSAFGSRLPFDTGPFLPVLVNLARFVPVAAFACYAWQRRVDPGLLEAARLYQRTPLRGLLDVRLPLYLPGLLLAGVLLLTLTAGELGATLLVAQPGAPTLMIRLYNLLHYGASRDVAALCLTLMAGAGIAGALALWGIKARPRFGGMANEG